MGYLAIMGGRGDTRITWSADNPTDVEAARTTFDDLTAKRYAAFAVNANDGKGRRIHAFDPAAEKIIVVPPLAGG